MSVKRPFFSTSSPGMIALIGIGRLAAATKHYFFTEKYEMI